MKPDANTPEQPRPLNRKELAQKMGISVSTLRRLMIKANLTVDRGLIPPARQLEILESLDWLKLTQVDAK